MLSASALARSQASRCSCAAVSALSSNASGLDSAGSFAAGSVCGDPSESSVSCVEAVLFWSCIDFFLLRQTEIDLGASIPVSTPLTEKTGAILSHYVGGACPTDRP